MKFNIKRLAAMTVSLCAILVLLASGCGQSPSEEPYGCGSGSAAPAASATFFRAAMMCRVASFVIAD